MRQNEWTGVTIGTALAVLPIVFVALRFISRMIKRVSFGLDDYLILPALVCQASIRLNVTRADALQLFALATCITVFIGMIQVPCLLARP